MRSYLCVVVVASIIFLGAGGREARSLAAEAPNVEDKWARCRQAEKDLFAEPEKAAIELLRRLEAWITPIDGGLITVDATIEHFRGEGDCTREHSKAFHIVTMPTSVPWLVSCAKGALEVTLGAWEISTSDGPSRLLSATLTSAVQSSTQCQELSKIVGKRLQELMKR